MICKDMLNTSGHIKTMSPLAEHYVNTLKVQSSPVRLKKLICYKSLLKCVLPIVSNLTNSGDKLSNH